MPAGQVASFVAAASGSPERAIAAVVALVGRARGVDVVLECEGEVIAPDPRVLSADVDDRLLVESGPWLPGLVREDLTGVDDRRREGIHHTDPSVAGVITDMALDGHDPATVTIGDPAVGGGVFLLAAAELLAPHSSPAAILDRLWGVDVDPLAVAVTRASLGLWAGERRAGGRVRVGDFLRESPFGESSVVDVLVGNPPFLGQLKGGTARSVTRAAEVRRRWSDVGGYVDESALFLLAGLDVIGRLGTVALVQPVSMLAARDAEPVRRRLLEEAAVVGFWLDGDRTFAAEVDTCAVVLRRGCEPEAVRRRVGRAGDRAVDHDAVTSAGTWAGLAAGLAGVPSIERPRSALLLGEVARCTAGFRDEYYGLRDAVVEDPHAAARLVTSGLIDPLRCGWGTRQCRYDRRRWTAPGVDLERVEPGVVDWVRQRLRPKLVVANQTRILEVAVDTDGSWVPCTPVVSVEPGPGAPSLWHIAAALSSPQVSAWTALDAAGSALSRDALRVSASRLARLPLPPSGAAWDQAARAARDAHFHPTRDRLWAVGRAAGAAYGELDDSLLEWWGQRLPGSDR
jgi:hypothetical protein